MHLLPPPLPVITGAEKRPPRCSDNGPLLSSSCDGPGRSTPTRFSDGRCLSPSDPLLPFRPQRICKSSVAGAEEHPPRCSDVPAPCPPSPQRIYKSSVTGAESHLYKFRADRGITWPMALEQYRKEVCTAWLYIIAAWEGGVDQERCGCPICS